MIDLTAKFVVTPRKTFEQMKAHAVRVIVLRLIAKLDASEDSTIALAMAVLDDGDEFDYLHLVEHCTVAPGASVQDRPAHTPEPA